MPNWALLRQRDQDLQAIRASINKDLSVQKLPRANNLLALRHGYKAAFQSVPIARLLLFREQELQAAGQFFFKASRFHRSKRYFVELRGATIAVFRDEDALNAIPNDSEAVISILSVQLFEINVVKKADGYPRIYLSSIAKRDDALMYIKVTGGDKQLDAWRHGLAYVKSAKFPSLQSLTIESVIGRGGGGKVFMVHWDETKCTYALKAIDKAHALKSPKLFRHVASERYLMEKAGKHPFLLQLQFAFQTESNLFIGTPFCAGGDLASYIRYRGTFAPLPCDPDLGLTEREHRRRGVYGRLTEFQTRKIATEIILGLEHLHTRGIVYRDLKPENVFIDGEGHIKIGDYGLAKLLRPCNGAYVRTETVCGTRNYIPPEMLRGAKYGFEADVWCLGVMLYRMLCGRFPFESLRTKELFHRVRRSHPKMPDVLSEGAKELLILLLEKNSAKRIKLAEVKRHIFFRDVNWRDVLDRRAGPAVPDVETGRCPTDALGNFELSKLQGVTLGEYVRDTDRGEGHVTDLDSVMIGFEYGLREEEVVQPLMVTRKSGGILSKIASIDYDQFPLTPRRSYGRGGSSRE